MLPKGCSEFRRKLWRKLMHYNVKAVPETLLGKTCVKNCFGWDIWCYRRPCWKIKQNQKHIIALCSLQTICVAGI